MPWPDWYSDCAGISADQTLSAHLTTQVLPPPFSQQLVSITWRLKNNLQVLSSLIQPPFPPEDKRITLLHLVHTAALLCFTLLANTEAREQRGTQAMGKLRRMGSLRWCLSFHHTLLPLKAKKYPISFLHPYAQPLHPQ